MSPKRQLLKVLAVSVLAGAVLAPSPAEARRVRVRAGGHARVAIGGHATVRVRAPRLPRRPGAYGHRHRHYYVAPPPVVTYGVVFADPPPPCCYSPAPPVPSYYYDSAPPAPAAAAPVVVAQAAPRARTLGVGLRASNTTIADGELTGSGVGAMLRLRGRERGRSSWELELDVGQDAYVGSGRADSRVGGAVYMNLGAGSLVPYLVAGGGLNVVRQPQVDGSARQGVLEAGAGLALRLGERFSILGDVRLGSRRLLGEDAADPGACCRPAEGVYVSDKETTAELRFAGIYWF